ncbi:MAG: hypothetical protein HEQ37_11785 [Acidovorax sp.]|nr:hypothetical protein [Acidovorax sp.]
MDDYDAAEILRLMREARQKTRGYASFFGWGIDRDLEELGPVQELAKALLASDGERLLALKLRGRGNDPPDIEAVNALGERVAVEVTELVDGDAIQAHKRGDRYAYAEWTRESFLGKLQTLLSGKAARLPKLKDAPYPGGYVIVVFTDEPMLDPDTVSSFLAGAVFKDLGRCRAYLLLSYWPKTEAYPFFSLPAGA